MNNQNRDEIQKVFALLEQGRTAEAMKEAQKLVDNNMSDAEAWFVYATAKSEWGDKELALKGYKQAIALNPNYCGAYIETANILIDLEDFDSAEYYVDKALQLSPCDKSALFFSIIITNMKNGIDAAIEKCLKCIEVADDKDIFKSTLGKLYVDAAETYIAEIPYDDTEENGKGFISLDDIEAAEKLCKEAAPLLKLSNLYRSEEKKCQEIIELCNNDKNTKSKKYGWFSVILHSLITIILYLIIVGLSSYGDETIAEILSGFWFLSLVLVPAGNILGNRFPIYKYNYAYYTGSADPLKSKNITLNAMADGANNYVDNVLPYTDTNAFVLFSFLRTHFWFFRARWNFYIGTIKKLITKGKK